MKKSKYSYLFSEKDNFIRLYEIERKSSLEIAKIYNINASAVCYLLNKFGVERRDDKHKSKFYLNEDFFEDIDSREKAYWLGFIFADGYITKDSYVGIALNSCDKEHLEKFKKAIGSNHIIHTYKCSDNCFSNPNNYYSRLLFKSEKMCSDLEKIGCVEHKSLVLSFPKISPLFYKDFIRGYFDGDGSLSFSKKSYDFKIIGTKEFLIEIFNILNKELSLDLSDKNLYQRIKSDKNTFYSSVGNKNKTKKFLNYIYKSSDVYLDRKYQKYLDFLDYIK